MNKRPDENIVLGKKNTHPAISILIVIGIFITGIAFCCTLFSFLSKAGIVSFISLAVTIISFITLLFLIIIEQFFSMVSGIETASNKAVELLEKMYGRFPPTVDKHVMISETHEDISKWKNRWHKRIEEQLNSDGISNAFAAYLRNEIDCMDSIPADEDEWYSNAFISYQKGPSDASDHISDMNTDLEKWKKAYIRKVNNSLESGTITKEKANSIIAKVESCTEIPKSQK